MARAFRSMVSAVVLALPLASPVLAADITPVSPEPDFTSWVLPIPAEAQAVFFERHSAVLTVQAAAVLDQAAPVLARYPTMFTSLRGYASNVEVGDEDEAVALGLARAQAVKAYLVARGVPEHLLVPYSRGTRGIVNPTEGSWGGAEVRLCVLAVAERPEPEDMRAAIARQQSLQRRSPEATPVPRA